MSLLTQFGATSPTLSFSVNSSFTTLDLGPTRIDFNLGTPRSEIPSHYPMVSHSPCDLSDQKQTNTKMKLPSNKNYTLLKSFGVSQPT